MWGASCAYFSYALLRLLHSLSNSPSLCCVALLLFSVYCSIEWCRGCSAAIMSAAYVCTGK